MRCHVLAAALFFLACAGIAQAQDSAASPHPVAPGAPVMLTGGIGASPQRQPIAIFYVKVADPEGNVIGIVRRPN